MKFKKICFSTKLSDLYGKDDYQSHIAEGGEKDDYIAIVGNSTYEQACEAAIKSCLENLI